MRYFCPHFIISPALRKMEATLAEYLRKEFADCVVSRTAVLNMVRDLKALQNDTSRKNPLLKTVDISTDVERAYTLSHNRHITIGQCTIQLQPIKEVIEL